MSAHNGGSGPRSNSYSENRFTNWSDYRPWSLEIEAVWKRFDGRIAKNPKFPKVIELKPSAGFVRPCTAMAVEVKLREFSEEILKDLRAVFILSGTKKQLKSRSWGFVGHYWRCCVFLHAYPFTGRTDPEWLRKFYINDVLVHEIGHHIDLKNTTTKDRERFAEWFVRARENSR